MMNLHEGGGTLPRPRGLIRPRPVAKVSASPSNFIHNFDSCEADFEKPPLPMAPLNHYKSLPRDFLNKFSIHQDSLKKRPPSPPKRQSLLDNQMSMGDSCESMDKVGHVTITTTVDLHTPAPQLPLPAYPSQCDSIETDLPLPPPPAPATPTYPGQRSWASDEQELIASLAKQPGRTGSDASFKVSLFDVTSVMKL